VRRPRWKLRSAGSVFSCARIKAYSSIGSDHDFASNVDRRHNTSTLLALVDLMKLHRVAALVVAASLGGCCLSASGCYPPGPVALSDGDGLGPAPARAAAPAPTQRLSRRAQDPGYPPRPASAPPKVAKDQAEDEDAGLDPDDARLERKLIICQGCALSGH
jgi:hypothetical protein